MVDVQGNKQEFELVTLFEFDNKRKMMSVVIKHNGVYKMLAKGADSAILERLSKKEQPFEKEIRKKLSEYSKEGLRTLCMGCKIFSEQEVQKLKDECLRIDQAHDKDKILPKFLKEVESNFFLLGCSAVEDRL